MGFGGKTLISSSSCNFLTFMHKFIQLTFNEGQHQIMPLIFCIHCKMLFNFSEQKWSLFFFLKFIFTKKITIIWKKLNAKHSAALGSYFVENVERPHCLLANITFYYVYRFVGKHTTSCNLMAWIVVFFHSFPFFFVFADQIDFTILIIPFGWSFSSRHYERFSSIQRRPSQTLRTTLIR
jgi:hypothetical protein